MWKWRSILKMKRGNHRQNQPFGELGKNVVKLQRKSSEHWSQKVRLYWCFLITLSLGTQDLKENAAGFRRKCRRVNKNRLVFIDGTGMRSEPRKLRALAPSGSTPRVTTKKHEKYEPRVDMWGAITYSVLWLVKLSLLTNERKLWIPRLIRRESKGIQNLWWKTLSRVSWLQKSKKLKGNPILCMDKGLAFKEEEFREAIKAGGARNLHDVWIFPTNTAKFVSPLDNERPGPSSETWFGAQHRSDYGARAYGLSANSN